MQLNADKTVDTVYALAAYNKDRFAIYKKVVDKYLDKCGRRWVSMETLFNFAIPAVQPTVHA
jgi:DNA polymerase alpha subunit A